MAKKESRFKGVVAKHARKHKDNAETFGYLKLSGLQQLQVTPGKTTNFNILPYIVGTNKHLDKDEEFQAATKGKPWYRLPIRVHKNVGEGDDKKTIICPTTFGKKCPICEHKALRTKQGADKEELAMLKYSNRALYVVQPVDKAGKAGDLQILDISDFCFYDQLIEEIAENEEYESFADTQDGMLLKVRFSKETYAGNTFAKASRIDFVERKAISPKVLKQVPNLEELVVVLPYEKIESLFFGDDVPGDEEDEDEEETTTSKSKSSKKPAASKAKAKDDDDDEDDEDDEDDDIADEEEEEEEEEKPSKSKAAKKAPAKSATKKSKAAKDDDDDDDDDDDEEDDDDDDDSEDDEEDDDDEEDESDEDSGDETSDDDDEEEEEEDDDDDDIDEEDDDEDDDEEDDDDDIDEEDDEEELPKSKGKSSKKPAAKQLPAKKAPAKPVKGKKK